MELTYTLNADDLLTHHLYTASQTKYFKKLRIKSQITFPIILVLCSIILFILNDYFFFVIYIVIAIIWITVYPFYSRWNLKRKYRKYVNKNDERLIGEKIEISILENKFKTKYFGMEAYYDLSEIAGIDEICNYYYIHLKTGLDFILPKEQISLEKLNNFLQEMISLTNLSIVKKNDWYWR